MPNAPVNIPFICPSMEEIAASLAEKEHVKIMPTGQYALNKIGLSTQVPMKMIYLTMILILIVSLW